MGCNVKIRYSSECSTMDPKYKELVIAGQTAPLKALTFDEVSGKFGGRITKEV